MSDSDDENYVTYGTPLEPLDEDNIPRKKPVLIQDQIAVDEKGRRRFHGAFTGGFSAGYFNTVGSRDGWTPQQFKSSRSNKAQSIGQQPQDFMDEEDQGEFGIAPLVIRPTDNFKDDTKKNLKRLRSRQINDQPIPGTPVLQDFLVPARERIGIKLLKKMGWKPGQGVGPRVTKKEKLQLQKQNEILKKYGCLDKSDIAKPSTASSDSESSGDEYANIKFAPSDFEMQKPVSHDSYFGLGYEGLNREPVLSKHVNLFDEPTLSIREKNKKFSIKGQAFGVGAFEAEDEDVYSRDDMSQYDFTLGPPEDKSRWSHKKNESKKYDCIEGFVPAKNPLPPIKRYDPPILPKDFKPIHVFPKSRFSPASEPSPFFSQRNKPVLSRDARARILSDPPTPTSTSTSTSNSSSAAQNIIVRTLNLHGREQTEMRQNIDSQKSNVKSSWMDKINSSNFIKGGKISSDLSEENSPTVRSDLKQPFAYDLDKQSRFERYLEFVKTGEEAKLQKIQPLSMNDKDREQEKSEFDQVIRLQNSGKEQPNIEKIEQPLENLSPNDAMIRAAKLKMFGKLTRRTETWQPSSIVCKRFNVPEPSVGCAKPETNKKKGYSVFNSMDWSSLSKFEKSSQDPKVELRSKIHEPSTSSAEMLVDIESEHESEKEKQFQAEYHKVFQSEDKSKNVGEGEVESSSNPAEDLEKKMDLFKSIFLSSEEDSDSEEENDVNDEVVKSALLGKPANVVNVQRNDSPPRGIFAKLDLDKLAFSKKKVESKEDSQKDDKTNESKEGDNNAKNKNSDELTLDVYGPILPSAVPSTQNKPAEENAQTQRHIFRSVVIPKEKPLKGMWVEKTKLKKSKKEKKKHKHKEKDKKKKSKKKKRE